MTYNLFDFDETEPDAWLFDVSECYTDDQKTNVNFRIPGDQVSHASIRVEIHFKM